MVRQSLPVPEEDESPRKAGDIPVYLRIEQVAQTYEHTGEAHRDAQVVQQPEEVEPVLLSVMTCKPPHCQQKCYRATMAGKPSFPRHEYLPEALPAAEIIVRLIEDAVPKPCTHDSADKQCIQKRVEEFHRHPFSLEEPFENEPSENKARYKQYGIPSDGQRTDMEYLRIHIPVYVQDIQHFITFYVEQTAKVKKFY